MQVTFTRLAPSGAAILKLSGVMGFKSFVVLSRQGSWVAGS